MEIEFTLEQLPVVAKKLTKVFRGGDIVGFSGQLSAGKTTLIGELSRAFGYHGRVTSPTFVIEHRYPIARTKNIEEIIHLDLYRLNKEDFSTIDWQEYHRQKNQLILVEWPERLSPNLLNFTKTVTIEILNEKKRRLTVSDNPGC